jgi:hypothetical protein
MKVHLVSVATKVLACIATVSTLASAEPEDDRRAYRLLRDDESWAWLRNPHDIRDPWDPLKYVRLLGEHRDDTFLTLGGEMRQWVEGYRNELWGQTGVVTNAYWLQRYMLHADAHFTRYVRVFWQLKSGIEAGRTGGPRPIDEDRLDFNQLFIDAVAVPGASLDDAPKLFARIGRQEMSYGSGRLIDVREGPNVRFGYDGFRIVSRPGPLRVDAFALRPDLTNPGVFDDGWDPHQAFWGTWSTLHLAPLVVDAYYLGLERDGFKYQKVVGKEWRHTVGGRVRGEFRAVDVEVEAAYQLGSIGSTSISAWTLASSAVLRGGALLLRPVLTLGFGATSGDGGPGSSSLGTFSPLFPRGAYFGLVSANGPSNEVSPHVALALSLPENLSVSGEVWAFWRESVYDGVYSVPGFLLRPGAPDEGRYLGTQMEGFITWQADRHLSLNGTFAYFAAGTFFESSAPGKDITYVAAWGTYKF